MSSLNKVDIKKCTITPADAPSSKNLEDKETSNSLDLASVGSVVNVDYFEDLLSPAVTVYLKISETANYLSKLPIRGYEKVELDIGISEQNTLSFGDIEGNPLFVSGIEDINRTESQATYTLVLSTVGNLRNEGSRCVKHYPRATIKAHIESILTDETGLNIDQGRIEIDDTSNSYTFMGNNRKPFYTCTWLSPKAQPVKTGKVDGTSGFVFYEDYKGYKFKSIDGLLNLVDAEQKYLNDPKNKGKPSKGVPSYTFTTTIDRVEDPKNQQKILDFYIDKAVNIQKNLRVGLYSNLTTVINPLNWNVEGVIHNLKEQVNVGSKESMNTAGDTVPIPESKFFNDNPSRLLVRILDNGMLDPKLEADDDGNAKDSGRNPADMAKAFTRYTLLFQQSLNITVPCNIGLRVGGLIYIECPDVGPTDATATEMADKMVDPEVSGLYLIRAVRHHFELGEGSNVTSLNLIRDSYGLN